MTRDDGITGPRAERRSRASEQPQRSRAEHDGRDAVRGARRRGADHDVRSAWTTAASGSASVAASSPEAAGRAATSPSRGDDRLGEPPDEGGDGARSRPGRPPRSGRSGRRRRKAWIEAVTARRPRTRPASRAGAPRAASPGRRLSAGRASRGGSSRRSRTRRRRRPPRRPGLGQPRPPRRRAGAAARRVAARTAAWQVPAGAAAHGAVHTKRSAILDRWPGSTASALALDDAVRRGAARAWARAVPALPRGRQVRRGPGVRLRVGRRASRGYCAWCPAPLHALAGVAAATTRIRLGIDVPRAPARPVSAARAIAARRALRGPRRAHAGLGYRDPEFDALGLRRDRRQDDAPPSTCSRRRGARTARGRGSGWAAWDLRSRGPRAAATA